MEAMQNLPVKAPEPEPSEQILSLTANIFEKTNMLNDISQRSTVTIQPMTLAANKGTMSFAIAGE